MKTMIAIPCMDTVPVGFVQSLLYMSKGQDTSVCFRANSLIYDARNLLSLTAIEQGFDRVLWLDSDMVFDGFIMDRMHRDLDNNPGYSMVTGVYVKRRTPIVPVLYDEIEEPERDSTGRIIPHIHNVESIPDDDSVFPVAGCGFGCVMTTTELLKKVWDKFGPAFAPYPWAGEDISFCYRVNQLGENILCDAGIRCGHIGQFVYTDSMLKGVGG